VKLLVELGRGTRDVAAWALHRLGDRVGSQAIHSLGDRVSGLTLRKLLLLVPPVWFLIWAKEHYAVPPQLGDEVPIGLQGPGETWLSVILDVALFALFVAGCWQWCLKSKEWWGKWRRRVRAEAEEEAEREILGANEAGREP